MVRFPAGTDVSVFHCTHTALGSTHPPSKLMDIRALSTGVERPGPETDDSPASGVEIEHACTFTFTDRRNGVIVTLIGCFIIYLREFVLVTRFISHDEICKSY